MGTSTNNCCCNDDFYSNDDYENLYRDLLKSFPRLNYNQLKTRIDRLDQQVSISSSSTYNESVAYRKSSITLLQDEYLNLKNAIIPSNNTDNNPKELNEKSKFSYFHKELVPSYNSLLNLIYKNNPKLNFLIWMFGFINENSKEVHILIIKEVYISLKSNKTMNDENEMTISRDFLINFFLNHIKVSLLTNNENYIKYISYLVSNEKADLTLLTETEGVYSRLFQKTCLLNQFLMEIKHRFIKIFNNNENLNSNLYLSENFLDYIHEEMPFLYDNAKLRVYFYNFIYEKYYCE